MWDKDDAVSRWVQGICGGFLSLIFLVELIMFLRSPFWALWMIVRYGVTIFGAGYLAWRCLKYAITGRDCINSEHYR